MSDIVYRLHNVMSDDEGYSDLAPLGLCDEAAAEITRLRAIVDKINWPMTADDVRIIPGTTLYHPDHPEPIVVSWIGVGTNLPSMPCVFGPIDGDSDELNHPAFYSTREAAEKAKERGNV
jgi:hypothetical protein